ncbi:GPI mannosyltransferase 1-like isoform X2 [Mangifera indica]|uniref:GPI mannosyltransferase 1-like isoform X2 n=1 Tax=Mangifera indica TaxID=29780 RepID=UPI001CF9F45F|nr:GPI mannosyltransferase 1-like isoform X2 [Mangifera indica]
MARLSYGVAIKENNIPVFSLLAYLLVPNSIIHHSWGNFLFSVSDLLVGCFIHSILKLQKMALIFRFALDLPFCLFLQFSENKVINGTILCLVLLLAASDIAMEQNESQVGRLKLHSCVDWGAQTHWLLGGYLLECQGKTVVLNLWVASMVFLAANTFILVMIIRRHNYSLVFEQLEAPTWKNAVKLK